MFRIVFATMAGAMLALPASAGTDATAGETVRVWEVDYSSRPPFKRTLVELPAADVARLETQEEVQTERVWSVDYSGRPPFKRSYEDLPVVDAARVETTSDSSAPVRPKPFFKKRHR